MHRFRRETVDAIGVAVPRGGVCYEVALIACSILQPASG